MMFAGGGCCDCGDPESWDPKGFCTYHKGPNETSKLLKLDKDVEIPCRMVCGYLIYLLSHAFSTQYNDVIYLPKQIVSKSSFSLSKEDYTYKNEQCTIEYFPNNVISHDNAKKEFVLFVHNDDSHNFDEGTSMTHTHNASLQSVSHYCFFFVLVCSLNVCVLFFEMNSFGHQ